MSPIFLWACLVAAVLIAAIISSSRKRQQPEPKVESVKCEVCRCLILETDAAKVENGGYVFRRMEYYCLTHKPPYDEEVCDEFYKLIPAHKVRVTKDGKEIKSKERSA